MDALKKAEQEKREAAKRLKESEDQDRLIGLADTRASDPTQPGAGKQAAPAVPRLEKTITGENPSALELSLAPIDQQRDPADVKPSVEAAEKSTTEIQDKPSDLPMQAPVNGDRTDSGEEEIDQPSRSVEEFDSDSQTLDLLERTFPGVDVEEETIAPRKINDTVEDEFEAEPPFHEGTLPGVPAIQLAEDLGGEDQPTPVAAQTVFTATNKAGRSNSNFRWLLIGCCVIAALAGSVWYYYTVTPLNVDVPSPLVAKGVESIVPAQPINPPSEAVAGSLMETPDTAANAGEGQSPPAAEAAVTENEKAAVPEADAKAAIAPQAPAVQRPTETVAATQPEVSEPGPAQGAREQDLPDSIELSPSLIQISRSKGIDRQAQLVNEAYAAYRAGDIAAAGEKYAQVLARHPDNRDALLGIGAVATRNGEGLKAFQAYSHLLRLNPKDRLARALLISLQSNAEIRRSESAIKVMIQENPDLPVLYFTLGNIYAEQARWAEAQQAFFDAYRQDSSNPDYALNLAISLDRMGQGAAALDYYNTALKLSDNETASFDPARIISRIETLSSQEKP